VHEANVHLASLAFFYSVVVEYLLLVQAALVSFGHGFALISVVLETQMQMLRSDSVLSIEGNGWVLKPP
jgi:hypothetical protein